MSNANGTKFTPGPWKWADGWTIIDNLGNMYQSDFGELEKYMSLELVGGDEGPIIPIRIDHYELIWDGKPLKKADRDLIASAPDLYSMVAYVAAWLEAPHTDKETLSEIRDMCLHALAKAEGRAEA